MLGSAYLSEKFLVQTVSISTI